MAKASIDQMALAGGIPVECLDPTAPINRYFAGEGKLTFLPDPKFRTPPPENAPRRIQFVRDPKVVTTLTGPLYNKPGQPPMFRVAEDLVDQGRQQFFRQQIEEAIGDDFARKEDLAAAMEAIQNEIADLREELADLKPDEDA